MPLDRSIRKVLVIGAGPIVIGQACEFDYSGTQACKALKEEGCTVILLNSNPATIMTDRHIADAVYIEPITLEVVEKIICRELPDSILPTMGGQTALNCVKKAAEQGILKRYGVRLIGVTLDTIDKAENRHLFIQQMLKIGLEIPRSFCGINWDEVILAQKSLGFPLIVRTSFTLGGQGGGIAYDFEELKRICEEAFVFSKELLLEESLIGWKEYELEVMKDKKGNCIVVCGIENINPMGVHTGDSITVSPIQTLRDKEYQRMRKRAFQIMEAIGMISGGCNVQFAVDPKTGQMFCIEVNPRVSRSSAFASKATGFPIAKIAAKLAVGYTLDELKNEAGLSFPSSFEPVMDYVALKIPRFDFAKFPQANPYLSTHMKSVGEVMAIGRTFKEALQKAISSTPFHQNLDIGLRQSPGIEIVEDGGSIASIQPPSSTTQSRELSRNSNVKILMKRCTSLDCISHGRDPAFFLDLRSKLKTTHYQQFEFIFEAFNKEMSVEEVHSLTKYDPWFLEQINSLVREEKAIRSDFIEGIDFEKMYRWKQMGFSDEKLAILLRCQEKQIAERRKKLHLFPVYKRVDTCSGEFLNDIAYMYSTYEEECESRPTEKKKVLILGSGPNRIGQGIEFDYCCSHAARAIQDLGHESIIINCNPATVSTDYDTADRLYFEPLTMEYVREVIRIENPLGTIIQFGGQTPLNIGKQLQKEGISLLGTSFNSIDLVEDRKKFRSFAEKIGIQQPQNGVFSSAKQALQMAKTMGFPMILRPSYVIGGNAIQKIQNINELKTYLQTVDLTLAAPILMEKFLEDAMEVDVDAIGDGKEVFICGILEQVEPAGVHSGDSMSFLSPYRLDQKWQHVIESQTRKIGKALKIVGLFNVQFAICNNEVFVLEVNLRASRTIPLLSKITGLAFVQIAMKCILGVSLKEQGLSIKAKPNFLGLKLPVFPFSRLHLKNELLGPQMKSTGEVLCIAKTWDELLIKARIYASEQNDLFTSDLENKLPSPHHSSLWDIYAI